MPHSTLHRDPSRHHLPGYVAHCAIRAAVSGDAIQRRFLALVHGPGDGLRRFEKKISFIQPILERVRFIHGRIGNPGCIQVRVDANAGDEPIYVTHFRQLWTACFREFLSRAGADDTIYFAPELLAPDIFYARTFSDAAGVPVEESDRWEQSLVLKSIAESCFEEAQRDA